MYFVLMAWIWPFEYLSKVQPTRCNVFSIY